MKTRNFALCALAVVVLAFALGAACSGGDEPDRPLELERPPPLTASADAQSVALGLGTFCWTSPGGGSALCADVFGIITGLTALPASAGEAVTVHGDLLVARASGVSGWAIPRPAEPIADGDDWLVWGLSPDDRVTLDIALSGDTLTFNAALPPGRYVVDIAVVFEQGDAHYGLLLDIAPTETSRQGTGGSFEGPPALTASAGANSVALGLGTFCWTSPGGPGLCADSIGIVTSRGTLPVGSGEAVTVSGHLSLAGASGVTGWAIPRPAEPLADGDDWLAWNSVDDDPLTVEIALSGDSLTFKADLPPGRYVVAVGRHNPDRTATRA